MPKSTARSFTATLEHDGTALNWVIVRVPFDVSKIWGKRGQIKVNGEINDFAFRTSLFPTGDGRHILLVNKRMQKGAGAALGTTARFRLEPDLEKREVAMPAELARSLAEDKVLRRWYEQLNYSTRHEIAKWVSDVGSAEARARRADQITERLLATMQAERDLPPILRVAFARDPAAEEGWKRMSATRRRGHLMAIFYYRTPEARARRVGKLIEDAHRYLESEKRGRGV